MPPLPGEELLVTLFADVHYYLNAPGSKPQHERFVRGAYVYLFYNATQRQSRLEVANHAGTPEQDAVDGHLDNVTVGRDTNQPGLATLVVDGLTAGSAPPQAASLHSWRLLSYDLLNGNKYMHRLHSLDIYFWTADDSSRFIDLCRRFLLERQLRLNPLEATHARASHSEHANAIHPLVQHLEQAAITDVYRPRASTASTIHSSVGKSESTGRSSSRADAHTPASLPNPAPYNPATPGAPETFTHREKTPPPAEAASGTGLVAAAAMEQPIIQSAVQQQHPVQVYATTSASFPPPPQVASPATPRSPNYFPNTISAVPPSPFSPVQQQYASYPNPKPYDTPLQSPDYFRHNSSAPTFAPPPVNSFAPPPIGTSDTSTTPLASPAAFSPYEGQSHQSPIHATFYRPTEEELKHGHAGSHRGITEYMAQAGQPQQPQQQPHEEGGTKPRRLEAKMGKVEGRVNKWFKKMDQRI